MSSTDFAVQIPGAEPSITGQRLLVTRRSSTDNEYRAIGYLDRLTDVTGPVEYRYRYLESAATDRVAPLAGFRDLRRDYRSPRLFPSFAERVMSAKRPDRPEYLAALDLTDTADSWEVLGASGGHREGDPVELIPLPSYDRATGSTSACFLAHGVRHQGPDASTIIDSLRSKAVLDLLPEPANAFDSRAVAIVSSGVVLGYVPGPLLDYVHAVLDRRDFTLTVTRANSAEAHPHLRLLLSLQAHVDRFVFDGPEWLPARP